MYIYILLYQYVHINMYKFQYAMVSNLLPDMTTCRFTQFAPPLCRKCQTEPG